MYLLVCCRIIDNLTLVNCVFIRCNIKDLLTKNNHTKGMNFKKCVANSNIRNGISTFPSVTPSSTTRFLNVCSLKLYSIPYYSPVTQIIKAIMQLYFQIIYFIGYNEDD